MTAPARAAATMILGDDHVVYDALRNAHRLRGWEIVPATSTEAAMRLAALRSEIDIVLVDVTNAYAARFLSEKVRHPAVARLRVFLVDADMKDDMQRAARDLIERIEAQREPR